MKVKVVLIVLLIGTAVWAVFFGGAVHVTRYPRGWYKTMPKLVSLKSGFAGYYKAYGKFPTGDLEHIVVLLSSATNSVENPKGFVFLELPAKAQKSYEWLHDGWGRPIHFNSTSSTNVVRLQSDGPNRKDDGGINDDVVVEIKASSE